MTEEVRKLRSTILLAEDDLDIRDVVQDVLEDVGFDVVPARTGKQALEFLSTDHRSPPDLVILDLMMPLVTGWQVLEVIQRDSELAKVPVVVVTCVFQDRPSGAAAFLQKPFRVGALIEIVERLLQPSP